MRGEALLIRHSLTEANEKHLYCGQTDLPLSEKGRAFALEISNAGIYKAGEDCSFFTSGMRRTDETLRLIFGDVLFTPLSELREINFGVFEMRSFEEMKDWEDYKLWISGDNEKNCCPGGESAEDMTLRVLSVMPRIFKEKCSVTLSHGGVIASVMTSFFSSEGKNRYQWQPPPCGGYRLLLLDGIPIKYETVQIFAK